MVKTKIKKDIPQWGMFTDKGNERIQKLVDEFKNELGDVSKSSYEDFKTHGLEFIKKWKKLWNTKTYGESSDTNVREYLFYFFKELGLQMIVPPYINMRVFIDRVWADGYWKTN